ncbi:unnamed protein product [Rotaria sordida]|uniref:Transglutaminase-like domain-containing protein n=2 Tax=Rotaria sordida TaxID=392033 RepID=A0A818L138_9BILA|nr:unnamed protein product [Rotaria sordida]CAF3569419.1 unnamed protein product [Rotaria sordida]CAF3887135.1 unnamed protein product [Rotaria sordida]
MGCKWSRVAPVKEPIPVKHPVRDAIPQPTTPSITNPNDSEQKKKKKKRTNSLTNEHIENVDDNQKLVNSLVNTQKNPIIDTVANDNDFVEIEVADPQAFNNSFIQQRQQAINNQSYRLTIQSWRPNSLEQLVNAVKSLSENKSLVDCNWIIFYWIAYNIEYDTVSYFSKNYEDQTAEGVFRTKKGVCAGYANIYKYLCDQLNIPCEKISGYSKGYGFDEREGAPDEIDHAWNAVEIDHHWYLIESTWGAGHLTEQKTFQHELESYYFFALPNEMIYHHLPENDKWQLLRKPINMKQYLRMPKIHPIYFQLNLDLISPRNQAYVDLLPEKSYALVLIRVPSDVRLIADLKLHNQKIEGGHRVVFDNKKQMYCCYFAPNTIGKHKITIYGKRGDTEGEYSGALDLTLNVNEIPKNPISFPKTWQIFFDLNLNIISPKNTHLLKVHNGQTHTEVQIQTPNNVELLGRLVNIQNEKIEGGHEVFYDRHKSLWRCKFAPNCNGIFDAEIMAKKKTDTGHYTSAVKFKIEAKNIPTPPLSYPHTWPLFYELDLKIETPRHRSTAVWPENASFSEIRMSAPNDVEFSCGIEFNGNKEESCTLAQFDNNKQQWQFLFAPQRTGLHKLIVYARRLSDFQTSYGAVAEFDLNVTKLRKPIKFPLTYSKFSTYKCRIYEPLHGVLKKDAIVPIHCVIPGATAVDLQVDSNWIETNGYEDPILKTEITVGSKDVTIYAKYGQNTSYDGLVRYSVK